MAWLCGAGGLRALLPSALGKPLDPSAPAALVFEPHKDGRYQLVAVEYVVPGPPDMRAPHLLNHDFTYLSSLGVWKLHAWIFRPNPAGMFADYNPNVRQCPS